MSDLSPFGGPIDQGFLLAITIGKALVKKGTLSKEDIIAELTAFGAASKNQAVENECSEVAKNVESW